MAEVVNISAANVYRERTNKKFEGNGNGIENLREMAKTVKIISWTRWNWSINGKKVVNISAANVYRDRTNKQFVGNGNGIENLREMAKAVNIIRRSWVKSIG
ncbi:hypothetical protein SLA2020_506220 [Shorea laevis]